MIDFLAPYSAIAGPRDAKMVLVGEAFGETEEKLGKPFAGQSGRELFRMLGDAWPEVEPREHAFVRSTMTGDRLWIETRESYLAATSIMFTNVFNLRPLANNIEVLCGKKDEVGSDYKLPHLRQGKYIKTDYFPHIERLRIELDTTKPNLIICLGNVACWAVLQATNIGSIRGNITSGVLVPSKTLPTFYPASILRQWSNRVIVLADLKKAWREKDFPEIRRPKRSVIVFPTREEIDNWMARNENSPYMAFDIETRKGQITDISFATTPREALVISFVYGHGHPRDGDSVYPDTPSEYLAWETVRKILSFSARKVAQNGLFDIQYLYRAGIYPVNCTDDTMLLHHSLFPEMKKGLGFLGSIYSSEASWKLMRLKGEEIKRDE